MGLAAATARFNRQAFKTRTATWPVTVTAKGYTGTLTAAKSKTTSRRVPSELGGGWVQQVHAVFTFAADGAFMPDIGAELTIKTAPIADEIGTIWRCVSLTRANPTTGENHRCECFRLD